MNPGLCSALAVLALAGCSTDERPRPSPAAAATGPVAPVLSSPPPPSPSPSPSRSSARTPGPSPRTTSTAPVVRVTAATLSLNPTSAGPFCRPGSVDVRYTWSVKVDSAAGTAVEVELHTSDGLAATDRRTAEKGTASGSGRYALRWDDGQRRRAVDFWLQTVSPGRVESRHVTFTVRCGPA